MLITDKQELKKITTEYRVWQGIPGVAVTKNGRMFFTFYAGGTNEEVGNYAMIVTSEDGTNFSEPVTMAYQENKRCFDPVLWIDPLGRLWFTWSLMPLGGVYGAICENPDADELIWGEEFFIGHDIMMNKPTVLSTGEWLFPLAVWDRWKMKMRITSPYFETKETETGSFAYRSVDQGKTFEKLGAADVERRQFDEHMILELTDGTLAMYVRTWYGIGVSYSYDKGLTWTEAKDSGLGGPGSRFHITRLRSGRILLINHVDFETTPKNPQGRNNLMALLSEDDGKTWKYQMMIDERNEVSYPDAMEAEDGFIYVTYDRERGCGKTSFEEASAQAREILYAKITEEDIIAGKLVNEQSKLKCIVSRLGDYAGDKAQLRFARKMEKVSVADYGVVPNSKEDQTEKIQRVIDEMFNKGGGEIFIPTGEYHISTLRLRSNICLHFMEDAVLIGSLSASDEENITILGEKGSTIDGGGLSITNCINVRSKSFTIRNAGKQAYMLKNCTDLYAYNLTVIGGHDGIHLTSCKHFTINQCHLFTEKNAIVGSENIHVHIENCEMDSACNAFHVGGTDIFILGCHICE